MVGLVAAMTMESDAFLRLIKDKKRLAIGPLSGFRFELADRSHILVTSGMGVRRAAEATRALVNGFSPEMLVSFGIAGAVEPDLEIGDVVSAESFCQLDASIPGAPQALTSLPDKAREAIVQTLAERGARLFSGTAITTGGAQLPDYKSGALIHPILEMETAGIARVAAEKKIPLLVLRAISDGPRAPIPFDLGEMMDADANLQIGKIMKAVIRDPKILLHSSQMIRNSRLAADNAAVAVIAALSHLNFG